MLVMQQEIFHSKMLITSEKVKDSEASPFIEQKDVILCRSGIQLYHKSELESFITEDNKPAVEKEWYKEYRPANVVVKAKDLFKSLPVTKEHPSEWVTPHNFSELAGGTLDKEIDVVALDGEAEGEIGLKSNITFYTDELYNYYLDNKEVSVGYTCKKHFVPNPEEVGYDIILDEITEVNHLAITRAGRGGSKVAVIDSLIGGIKPMRTGIFAYLKSICTKQAVNDSAPSFGKTVLEAVKNSKGTTEEELAGEMKGVLDSMTILKDCEAKTKLMDVVKDCFDNKEMTLANEEQLTSTLDAMWIDIHSDSLSEIAKAFAKLGAKPNTSEGTADTKVKDSGEDKKDEAEDKAKDNESSKEGEDKDSDKKEEEGKEEDSKDADEDKGKDGCSKDSAVPAKDALISAVRDCLKTELKPLVEDAVKECLGLKKDSNGASIEGSELDSAVDVPQQDYESFILK